MNLNLLLLWRLLPFARFNHLPHLPPHFNLSFNSLSPLHHLSFTSPPLPSAFLSAFTPQILLHSSDSECLALEFPLSNLQAFVSPSSLCPGPQLQSLTMATLAASLETFLSSQSAEQLAGLMEAVAEMIQLKQGGSGAVQATVAQTL